MMSNWKQLADNLDSEDMLGYLRNFPNDCASAFHRINPKFHPWITQVSKVDWRSWMCVGMGGSAAGASFLADLAGDGGSTPVHVHRNYGLPSWWEEKMLVIATSYSGNTEETINSVEMALEAGGTVIVISSGGILAGLCEVHENAHLVLVPGGQPPRSAFGHLFGTLMSLGWAMSLFPKPSDSELVAVVNRLQDHSMAADFTTNPDNDIAHLAFGLAECPIAIIASMELTGAGDRFRNQINENAARYARVAILPEMNHNEIVAWGDGDDNDPESANQGLIMLAWQGMNPRVVKRMNWFTEHLRTETAWKIDCEGDTLFEAMLHACIDMDWLSCGLGLLNDKDPSSIGPITQLKDHLSTAN